MYAIPPLLSIKFVDMPFKSISQSYKRVQGLLIYLVEMTKKLRNLTECINKDRSKRHPVIKSPNERKLYGGFGEYNFRQKKINE